MRNVYPRGPLSLTWGVTFSQLPTSEKSLYQRPTESDLEGNCEKCLSQRPHWSLTWLVTVRKVLYPRGPLSLTWRVTVRNVNPSPRALTESDLAGNCEK